MMDGREQDETLQSWLDELPDIYGNYSYGNESECCDGGDICDLAESTKFESVFIPVLYSVVFVVGFLENGVLLQYLAQNRRNWSVTDTFILHLGVADVLMLLTLPLWAAQHARNGGWTFGTPLCKITGTVFTTTFYSGILLLACISLDCYFSIVHATQMHSCKKHWVVQASCFVVWFFSLLLSIPDWIFLESVWDERRSRTECVPNYFKFGQLAVAPWRLTSRLIYHIMGFLLPSAIMVFCYSCILCKLRCGTQNLQKQKAFKVIMSVVVVFFLCWTPYNITLLVDTIHSRKSNETCSVTTSLDKAQTVTKSVGFMHCCLKPILYAIVDVKFRRQLLNK